MNGIEPDELFFLFFIVSTSLIRFSRGIQKEKSPSCVFPKHNGLSSRTAVPD